MTPLPPELYARRRRAVGARATLALCCAAWVLAVLCASVGAQDQDPAAPPQRLIDRLPFDRVTLDAANQNAVFDTQILDLPDRRKVRPFPESGSLALRRLSDPSTPYEVSWSAIAKVELFEELLLAEAERLTAAKSMDEAFEYFSFLLRNYQDLPGVEAAAQGFLWEDATIAFRAKRYDDALASMLALYDRNARYPRLASAVDAVANARVNERLAEADFAGARRAIDLLASSFPRLELASVTRWRQKFQTDAAAELAKGREALAAQDFSAAREAVRHARGILPDIAGADELLAAIQDAAPEVRVGVLQPAPRGEAARAAPLDWASVRARELTDPQLVEITSFGAEGGEYESPWARIDTNDEGTETTLTATPRAAEDGVTAAAISRRLLAAARPDSPFFGEVFGSLATSIDCAGDQVTIFWRRPHIRPVSLLRTPLRGIAATDAVHPWYELDARLSSEREARYSRPQAAGHGGPQFVVEFAFADDEAAIMALGSGEIDVVDRVPPWQVERLAEMPGVRLGRYRLPTVHVLLLNYDNPLVDIREFRRALSYGIDRESIVSDLLLAGKEQTGFRVASGPFVAGENSTDPIGYAYDEQISPRPYEPRLASVLSTVARTSLAKREAAAKGKQSDVAESKQPAEDEGESSDDESPPADLPPAKPLRLAHSSDPVARLACQTIKAQLDQAGIPVELVELGGDELADKEKYDLRYAELAMWDPIADARRLLGPRGLAGQSSAYMTLGLDRLEQAENWSQVIQRAKELHAIAHADLPVIPLWQTINYFAFRDWLQGIGETPVALYQDVPEWRKTFAGGAEP